MGDRLWYGFFGIWCLGYLTYVIVNLDDYSIDHGRTLIAFWGLLSFLAIKRYIKATRTWLKQKKNTQSAN